PPPPSSTLFPYTTLFRSRFRVSSMLRREMRAPTAVRTGADRTLELLEAQIGRSLDEVETPVAVLDLERLEANLQRLQSYADTHRSEEHTSELQSRSDLVC